jgi:hypothetical protein
VKTKKVAVITDVSKIRTERRPKMSIGRDRSFARRPGGTWDNKRNDADKASSLHKTQKEAEQTAKRMLQTIRLPAVLERGFHLPLEEMRSWTRTAGVVLGRKVFSLMAKEYGYTGGGDCGVSGEGPDSHNGVSSAGRRAQARSGKGG